MSTSTTNTKQVKFEWWAWTLLKPTPFDSYTQARD